MYWFRVFLALILLAQVACRSTPERDLNTVFRFNAHSGISSLDPAFARDQYSIWACNLLYNGLVEMNDQLEVRAAIAHSWTYTDSNLTYTFHLRNDVRFHDDLCFPESEGRRVSAGDFVYSFERLRDPALAAPGAWVFKDVERFYASSDSTLHIQLKRPFPAFLGILSMKYCSVIPAEAVAYYGGEFGQHAVGTGAFQQQLWSANEKLILRRNPRYFERDEQGRSLPYLEAVAISFIPDKQSGFMEFVKGQLDFLSGLDPSYKDELLDATGELQAKYAGAFELYRQDYLNTEYLGIFIDPSSTKPLQQRAIRQAINCGFDRAKMLRYLRNNIGTPAEQGIIPKGLPAFDATAEYGYTYNPERARKLLEEAGYPNGQNLPNIKLQTTSSYLDLCEYIQSSLKTLGIKVEVEVMPPASLRQAMATGKVDFFRASWIADYPDAENYLSLFYSENAAPNGPNYTHFSSPLYDSTYTAALRIADFESRLPLYRQMDSLIMYEAAIVPLYYDQVLRFYPPEVKGLGGNALNLLDLRRVYKDSL